MKKEYIVSPKAGFEVAGIRNPGNGKSIFLTDAQAEQPLRTGEILRPAKDDKAPSKTAKSKASEK